MKKKKQKRGFKTKKETLEWESNFKLSANDTEPNNSIVTHASNIYNLANNPYKKVKKMGKADVDKIDFWTKADDFEHVIQYVGIDKIDTIVTNAREREQIAESRKQHNRVYGMSR